MPSETTQLAVVAKGMTGGSANATKCTVDMVTFDIKQYNALSVVYTLTGDKAQCNGEALQLFDPLM